jgi:PAS domain S-box-containing protein
MMSRARILIVEDDRIVAADLQARLEDMGYTVLGCVATGEDAVTSASHIRPDLALMDIRLKGESDGIETAGELRGRFGVPVVYLTAYKDRETLNRAQATDPYGYIVKPFDERELDVVLAIAMHRVKSEKARSEIGETSEMNAAGEGILALDSRAKAVFVNDRIAAWLGYKVDEMIGRQFTEFLTPEAEEEAKRIIDRSRQGVTEQHSVRITKKDGTTVKAVFDTSPIVNDGGKIIGALCCVAEGSSGSGGHR